MFVKYVIIVNMRYVFDMSPMYFVVRRVFGCALFFLIHLDFLTTSYTHAHNEIYSDGVLG